MASWGGFSEEELRRIQQRGEPNEAAAARPTLARGRRAAPTNRSRQQLQREKALQLSAKPSDVCVSPLSPDQQLMPTPPHAPSHTGLSKAAEVKSEELKPEPVVPVSVVPVPEQEPVDLSAAVKELDKVEVELREKTRLQQLQWEQRVMEEKNKKRKALLAKTIAEKSKQTQAEAVKLKKIQKELQALDDSVSTDIGILRKLIEQSSLEYSIAWKRLEKAEAEYVAAKLDLHKKTEVKEQLTEHLTAIIQQNELRKALKLDELMFQLELSAEAEGAPESHSPPATEELDVEKKEQNPPQPAVVNRPAVESDEKPQKESTGSSKDSSTTVPQHSQDQEGELFTATTEGRS